MKFDSPSNAIYHSENFHGYDRYAIEKKTGLTHYDKELWDMLPINDVED